MFYPLLNGPAFNIPGTYAAAAASVAENAAREAQTEVEVYKHDLNRLLLITEALWFLMKEQHGYTEDVLVKLIQEIDHGKTTASGIAIKDPPMACAACKRINASKRTFCLYCGKPLNTHPFAR
jgi:hypothetical protein